jgi:MFS family permease
MGTLTKYNITISIIVALGTYSFGFGFGVFFSAIGQPGFYRDFDLDPTSSYTASILGAVNALCSFGCALGSIAQGWMADKWGRKKALMVAAIFSAIGAALTAGSTHVAMLVTVRILNGFGLGMLICLVPLYLTETAPARFRGSLAGMTV